MRKQNGGVIVNTASVVSVVGIHDRAAYCASKGAVSSLTKAMAIDHARDGIRVNCIAPGTIDSPYFDRMFAASPDPGELRRELEGRHIMNRLGTAEEIAKGMLYLACDDSSFVTGTTLLVDGGMTAW
jgi:NAD(P)-dependent dehydrogenase (short-subunit alcohol dehydrogenase family)